MYHFIKLLYGLNKLMFMGKRNRTVVKLLYDIIVWNYKTIINGHSLEALLTPSHSLG